MKTLIWVFIFAVVLMVGCVSMPHSTVLYYIPFQIETYTATTPETIRDKAHFRVRIKSKADIVTLLDVLAAKGAQGSELDRKRVRLAIEIEGNNNSFMVDAEGNVSDGKSEYALGALRFQELKRFMDRMTEKQN